MELVSARKDGDVPVIGIDEFMACPGVESLRQGCKLAVALSGGPDSMALCWLLSRWAAQQGGAEIHALTVDHGLRPEANEEARQVGVWVKDWPHVRHEILRIDAGEDNAPTSSIMENAREGRYKVLDEYCRAHNIRKLFVAHHREDQAETFLFRLAKGSGLDGLAAMRYERPYNGNLTIVRPLLDFAKEQLIAICAENDIPCVRDPTNDDTRFARNRLRRAYDVLEREGLTAKRLSVTAGRIARAREALDYTAQKVMKEAQVLKESQKVILDRGIIEEWPSEIRLRVIIKAMAELLPAQDGYGPRMEKLEKLVSDLFEGGTFRRRTLGGFIVSERDKREKIVIEVEK
jgi:tRNA(Ile)-lysidine synthase